MKTGATGLIRRARSRRIIKDMKAKPKSVYVVVSPQTWELARAAYLSGLSAPTVAARFGVGVCALRKRARREGWTKAAYARSQAESDAARLTAESSACGPAPDWAPPRHVTPANVARKALNDAVGALWAGRPAEAQAYAKAARAMMQLEGFVPDIDEVESEAQFQWRQSIIQDVIAEQAGRLIDQLTAGEAVDQRYAALAERWRRKTTAE
jgi:hypothetical protein